MPQMPINDIRDSMNEAIAKLSGDNKIIVIGCDNALKLSQLESADTQCVSLFCIGMMPASLVEYALVNGADGVLITGCRS